MPPSLYEWQSQLKSVESEFLVIAASLTQVRKNAELRAEILTSLRLNPDNFRSAERNLEGTFIIRVFAEFETCLRDFWSKTRNPRPPSRTQDLIDGVASKRKIESQLLDETHLVREFRNALVHERDQAPATISIVQARSRLCKFLKHLPSEW